jgi:hypothetical protein
MSVDVKLSKDKSRESQQRRLLFNRRPCCPCSYTPSVKRCLKELLFQSIPVSIAASLSQFVQCIIAFITSHASKHEYAINLEIGQTLIYCLIVYGFGRYFTYRLKTLIDVSEVNKNPWIKFLEKQQYISIIFGIFAENSGFAWKQFAVLVILTFFYQQHDLIGTIFIFLTWIFICLCIFVFGYWISHCYFKLDHEKYYDVLLDYDSDAFALSVAFVTVVILALMIGMYDEKGYLFEWETYRKTSDDDTQLGDDSVDDYSYTYSFTSNDDSNDLDPAINMFYSIDCFFVTFLICLVLMIEDRLGIGKKEENSKQQRQYEIEEKIQGGSQSGSMVHPSQHDSSNSSIPVLIEEKHESAEERTPEIANSTKLDDRLSKIDIIDDENLVMNPLSEVIVKNTTVEREELSQTSSTIVVTKPVDSDVTSRRSESVNHISYLCDMFLSFWHSFLE